MTTFLVVVATTLDDIPVRIFTSRDAAERLLNDKARLVTLYKEVCELLGRSWAGLTYAYVLQFNSAGVPIYQYDPVDISEAG